MVLQSQNRIDDIIDIINGGSGTETITYPSTAGVDPHLQVLIQH